MKKNGQKSNGRYVKRTMVMWRTAVPALILSIVMVLAQATPAMADETPNEPSERTNLEIFGNTVTRVYNGEVQAFPKCVTIRGLKDGHSAYYCNNLLQYDGSGRFTGLDRFGGAAEGAVKLRWTATAMSRPASPPAGTRLP